MTSAILSPSSSKIKFRLAGGAQPLILLPIHVNDRGPFDFILDTGAGTSLVSIDLAKELDLKTIGSKQGQTAGGNVAVALARVDSIAAGEIKLEMSMLALSIFRRSARPSVQKLTAISDTIF